MSEDDLYVGREQTLVKHTILRAYLRRFAIIVGSWADSITYVHCFSGPWRERYLVRAKEAVLALLRGKRRVAYDQAWKSASTQPLVWESDLKDWIREWKKAGRLSFEGMGPRQQVPHRGEGHSLVWK